MKQYLDLAKKVITDGQVKKDRTRVGTQSLFGYQMRIDLTQGFPLLTTKCVAFRLIKTELLWFLRGDTNIRYLLEHDNHIWDEWAFEKYIQSDDYQGPDMTDFGLRILEDEAFKEIYDREMKHFNQKILTDDNFAKKYGDLGNVYGAQWRHWPAGEGQNIDQIEQVICSLRENPHSRRHLVSAWNPREIPDMALPPCHTLFQFYICDGRLSCQLYQRSGDLFLGVPFNIASYALLTHLIAREVGLEVGEFIHTFGDVHIYLNHQDQIKKQLARQPRDLPKLKIHGSRSLFDLEPDDIEILDYRPHKAIKAPIAV